MPHALMEALSPRSANLPMKPPAAVKKTKTDTRTKATQSAANPDKIDEKWRPAGVVREPGPDGDAYLTGRKLGRGGFAVCFEGRSERNRNVFALKVVKSQVEQKKQLEKVVMTLGWKKSLLTQRQVSNRIADPCKDAPSKHRGILSCFCFRKLHLCRPRTMSQWLTHGHGQESEIAQLARGPSVHDSALWWSKIHASTVCNP